MLDGVDVFDGSFYGNAKDDNENENGNNKDNNKDNNINSNSKSKSNSNSNNNNNNNINIKTDDTPSSSSSSSSTETSDPLGWLPSPLPPSVRLILTSRPTSLTSIASLSPHNSRPCLAVKRRVILDQRGKERLADGVAKFRGFATSHEALQGYYASDLTSSIGFAKFVLEEVFFRGVFEGPKGGKFNVEMRWGVWESDPRTDTGGEEMDGRVRDIIGELLQFDSVRGLWGVRARRLCAEVPFFAAAVSAIRLSHKGLGELDLRAVLGGRKVVKRENRRLVVEKKKRKKNVREERKKAEMKAGKKPTTADETETKEEVEEEVTLDEAETVTSFTNDHWILLNGTLRQLCLQPFGKFTLIDPDVVRAVDATVNELSAELGNEKWQPVFLTALIETFTSSLVSLRRCEELPHFLRLLGKHTTANGNGDKSDKTKLQNIKDRIVKECMNTEMLFRMNAADGQRDDLLSYLHYSGASKGKILQVCKDEFDGFFGINGKVLDKLPGGGYGYHLLEIGDLGKCETMEEFER